MAQGAVNSGGGSGRELALTSLATSEHILSGYQALTPNGKVLTGTMPEYGDLGSIYVRCSETYNIPAGHIASGSVTGVALSEQTIADATAADILIDKTAWVNGVLLTGTMPNNPIMVNPSNNILQPGQSYQVPQGYTPGGTILAASISDVTPGTAIESDILINKTAWVNGVQITGTIKNLGNIGKIELDGGDKYNIVEGYYTGGSIVSIGFSGGIGGTAREDQILAGETAWVNGTELTGTMPDQGDLGEIRVKIGEQFEIPEGYISYGVVLPLADEDGSSYPGDATAKDILKGKKAWVNGALVTGNVGYRNLEDTVIAPGKSITVQAGIYQNKFTISANALAIHTPGTANASHIKEFFTAWVNGRCIEGTMPVNDDLIDITLEPGQSIEFESGYYEGISISVDDIDIVDNTPGTATPADILNGKTAWVYGEQITGVYIPEATSDITLLTSATATPDKLLLGETAWVNGEMITGTLTIDTLEDLTPATARPAHILEGQTAWVNGGLITGTMPEFSDRTAGTATPDDLTIGKTAWVNGEMIVGVTNLVDTTAATATPETLLDGETAWVNGELIMGTIPIYGADDEVELIEVKVGEEYTIPAGYYQEGAVVIVNEKVQFVNGTANAADVLENKTIMVNGEPVQGTIPIRSIADIVKVN